MQGIINSILCVLRGGSHFDLNSYCRSFLRSYNNSHFRILNCGLRVVVEGRKEGKG